MRGGRLQSFDRFVGGVNAQDAPYQLADNEARDARNVVGTQRGAIRKRDGAVTLATPASQLHSLAALQSLGYLLGAGGTSLYRVDPAGAVTVFAAGLLTAGAKWEWILAPAKAGQGPAYGLNGVEARYFTGSATGAWTAGTGTLPLGKYLVFHGRRVWVAGMAAYGTVNDPGSTVVFSNLADPRDWPAANVVEFDPNDGEAITGLATIGPYVLVFKPSKTWVIYDLDTGANRRVGDNVGAISHRSVVETPEGTFFLSKDQGVMVTDGTRVKRVSDRVKTFIDLLLPSDRANATAAFLGRHYYLSIATTTPGANDLLLDYDTVLDCWWVHTLGEQDLAVWEASAGSPGLFGSKGGQAVVERLFSPGATQDNGANFAAYWLGPFHTFKSPFLRKRVREIHFDGKGKIDVSLAKSFARAAAFQQTADFTGTDGLFGTNDGGLFGTNDGGLFGGARDVAEARVLTPGVARAWSVMFGNATVDPFEIESYTFAYDMRRD